MDDLYLIKVAEEKLKVGISRDAKKRITNIQNAGGYADNQIETKIFPTSSHYEELLKSIFKDYQIKGEWFEYEGLVKFFHINLVWQNRIDLQIIESLSQKYDNSIDFDFQYEEGKINLKKAQYESKKKIKEGLITINSSIVNLSQSEMGMIKTGELFNLHPSFVDFFFGDIFVTWQFKEKPHIIEIFLTKLNIDYRKL